MIIFGWNLCLSMQKAWPWWDSRHIAGRWTSGPPPGPSWPPHWPSARRRAAAPAPLEYNHKHTKILNLNAYFTLFTSVLTELPMQSSSSSSSSSWETPCSRRGTSWWMKWRIWMELDIQRTSGSRPRISLSAPEGQSAASDSLLLASGERGKSGFNVCRV